MAVLGVLVIIAASLAATVTNGQVQFPCNHILRQFPSLSSLFEHCECRYGNWTTVVPHPNTTAVPVDRTLCESGLKIRGVRYRHATGGQQCNTTGSCGDCTDMKEETWACKTDCSYYGNGTDVVVLDGEVVVTVPRNQCRSGKAVPGRQFLLALSGYECNNESICKNCEDKWMDVYVCEPPLEVLLYRIWDLGGSGYDVTSIASPQSSSSCRPNCASKQVPAGQAPICDTMELCEDPSHMDVIGRRSTKEETEFEEEEEEEDDDDNDVVPKPLPVDPLPFYHAIRHPRYRRQNTEHCNSPNTVRHVLFMLDTSGSIGEENFNKMTQSLSRLVGYFCRKIKVAAMVFNHDHYLEFCFDCFDNNCAGRRAAAGKMQRIPYRRGLTHTASATRCACNNVLQPRCGFDPTATSRACLDVIYVTDGKSNDPAMDVCREVNCIHTTPHSDVNVYVFGIGRRVRDRELKCIARQGSGNSIRNVIFKVDNFNDFSSAIADLHRLFTNPAYRATLSLAGEDAPNCFTSNPTIQDALGSDSCTLSNG